MDMPVITDLPNAVGSQNLKSAKALSEVRQKCSSLTPVYENREKGK